MQTKKAQKKDKEMLKKLWEISLKASKPFLNWYFERVFNPDNTFITSDDVGTISSFSIIPQNIKLSGVVAEVAYISGLAIPPEYRDEDTIKKQLADVVKEVSDMNCLLSVVIPENYKFYERYGWRTAYNYKQYDIKPSDLPAYCVKNNIKRAQISDNIIAELSQIYDDFMKNKNAYVIRTNSDWSLILEDLSENFGGHCVIFTDSENQPAGYILYIIRDKKMGVYEFAYKNRTAYESIMGFIRQHEPDINNVVIKAAIDDLSYLDFCDNREAVRFCPFAMARLSDAKRALEIASVNSDKSFKFQIIDRLVEKNNKTFSICNGEVNQTDEEADVVTDIGALTQMFMGYISVDEAKRMNLITGKEEYLKQIFGKKVNYINMLLI